MMFLSSVSLLSFLLVFVISSLLCDFIAVPKHGRANWDVVNDQLEGKH